MKINTTFNVGDRVWVMKDNKPYQFKIHKIDVEVYDTWTRILYVDRLERTSMLDSEKLEYYNMSICYKTKKELLESFIDSGDTW